MESSKIASLQEAYLKIYEATGREEMLASNIARARLSGRRPTTTPVQQRPQAPQRQVPSPSRPTPQAQPSATTGGLLGRVDSTLRDVAGRVGGEIGAQQGRQRYGNLFGIPEVIGRNKGTQQAQQFYDRTLGGFLKQDYQYDAFDIILEYLISEGYANNQESALAIMVNMSEEWRNSILLIS